MKVLKTSLTALAGAAILATTIGTASAAPNRGDREFRLPGPLTTPLINRRMENQRKRIRRGIRSGELTRYERRYLRENLRDIRWTKRRMARDGVITVRERYRLMSMLDANGRKIRRLKNNNRRVRYDRFDPRRWYDRFDVRFRF